MIVTIPEEVYTMKAKRSIIKSNALLYRKASKKEKKEILDDLGKPSIGIGNTLRRLLIAPVRLLYPTRCKTRG